MTFPEIPQDAIEAAANQMRSQIGDFTSSDMLMRKRAKFVLRAALPYLQVEVKEPTAEEIDAEALRIANAVRSGTGRINFLSTLAPHAQGRYRAWARKNLESK